MRLSKEYQRLSRECACYLEQAKVLKRYVKRVSYLNATLRKLLATQKDQSGFNTENDNTWMQNGGSHSQKRTSGIRRFHDRKP